MSESVIEVIKLKNGNIALRNSEEPDHHLVTISFSEPVQNMLQGAQMIIAQRMIQAGVDTFRQIQLEQLKAVHEASQQDKLH